MLYIRIAIYNTVKNISTLSIVPNHKKLPPIIILITFIATSCSVYSTLPTSTALSTIVIRGHYPATETTQEVIEAAETSTPDRSEPNFDRERAMKDVEYQLKFGPRIPGSIAHESTRNYILDNLTASGWETEVQSIEINNKEVINIVGKKGTGKPWVILGAHYDSRIFADRDPVQNKQDQPVPGANDGASGVAVLLELARSLPEDLPVETWLVFFDAEDNGNIPGWEWIMGSTAFANNLEKKPDKVVIVDMIGDVDLNILIEQNSTPELVAEVWQVAADLNYSKYFINTAGLSILDDHTPFLYAGIPAIDIIDIDYPYWHTTEDTFDKVSPNSLDVVGKTLYCWLINLK